MLRMPAFHLIPKVLIGGGPAVVLVYGLWGRKEEGRVAIRERHRSRLLQLLDLVVKSLDKMMRLGLLLTCLVYDDRVGSVCFRPFL